MLTGHLWALAGLTIEEKTGQAMVKEAAEVLKLPGGRLLMEAQTMFSYGAAAASLRLLWRYRLLDVLVPPLAERFTRRRLPRCAQTLAASASGGSLYYWWQLDSPVQCWSKQILRMYRVSQESTAAGFRPRFGPLRAVG